MARTQATTTNAGGEDVARLVYSAFRPYVANVRHVRALFPPTYRHVQTGLTIPTPRDVTMFRRRDSGRLSSRSEGSGSLRKRWRHRRSVTPAADGATSGGSSDDVGSDGKQRSHSGDSGRNNDNDKLRTRSPSGDSLERPVSRSRSQSVPTLPATLRRDDLTGGGALSTDDLPSRLRMRRSSNAYLELMWPRFFGSNRDLRETGDVPLVGAGGMRTPPLGQENMAVLKEEGGASGLSDSGIVSNSNNSSVNDVTVDDVFPPKSITSSYTPKPNNENQDRVNSVELRNSDKKHSNPKETFRNNRSDGDKETERPLSGRYEDVMQHLMWEDAEDVVKISVWDADRPNEAMVSQQVLEGQAEKQPMPVGNQAEKQPTSVGNQAEKQLMPTGNQNEKQPTSNVNQAEKQPTSVGNQAEKQPTSVGNQAEKQPTPSGNQAKKQPTAVGNQAEKQPTSVGNQAEKQPMPVENQAEKQPSPVGNQTKKQPTSVGNRAEKQPSPIGNQAEKQPTPVGNQTKKQPTSVGNRAEKQPTAVGNQAEKQPTPVGNQAEKQPTAVGNQAENDSTPAGNQAEKQLTSIEQQSRKHAISTDEQGKNQEYIFSLSPAQEPLLKPELSVNEQLLPSNVGLPAKKLVNGKQLPFEDSRGQSLSSMEDLVMSQIIQTDDPDNEQHTFNMNSVTDTGSPIDPNNKDTYKTTNVSSDKEHLESMKISTREYHMHRTNAPVELQINHVGGLVKEQSQLSSGPSDKDPLDSGSKEQLIPNPWYSHYSDSSLDALDITPDAPPGWKYRNPSSGSDGLEESSSRVSDDDQGWSEEPQRRDIGLKDMRRKLNVNSECEKDFGINDVHIPLIANELCAATHTDGQGYSNEANIVEVEKKSSDKHSPTLRFPTEKWTLFTSNEHDARPSSRGYGAIDPSQLKKCRERKKSIIMEKLKTRKVFKFCCFPFAVYW